MVSLYIIVIVIITMPIFFQFKFFSIDYILVLIVIGFDNLSIVFSLRNIKFVAMNSIMRISLSSWVHQDT